MLRCLAAAVLDYWKQEMAVTGDETESGRVSLIQMFYVLCANMFSFTELFMHGLHMLSRVFSKEDFK